MNTSFTANYISDNIDFRFIESRPGITMVLLSDTPFYTILAVSNDFVTTSGRTREEVIGKSHFEVFPENPAEPSSGLHSLLNSFEYILQHKTSHSLPITRYDIPDGKGEFLEKYWKITNAPVFNEKVEVEYVIHTSEDVTDQVKMGAIELKHQELLKAYRKNEESQLALQESLDKYRNLFDFMGQGYCTIEVLFNEEGTCIDYRYLEINPVFEKQSGLVDAVGKTIRELAPDIETHWFDFFGNVAQTGKPDRITDESIALQKWFEIYAIRVGSHGSNKVGVFFTDVTDRKKAEEAIRRSESNLRNTILQAPVAMAILKGPTFIVEIANDSMYTLWGRSREELLNEALFEKLPEVKNQGYEELLTGVYTTGESFAANGVSVTLPRKDGIQKAYINLLYEAFREGDGTISGVIVVATDVTDQVIAKNKVEESEQELHLRVKQRTEELENQTNLLNNILTHSSNGISVTEMIRDEKGEIVDVKTILANDAAIRLTGIPREIYLSKTAKELDPNIFDSAYGKTCMQTLKWGEPSLSQYHMESINKWLELTISRMDSDHLIHIFTDVTPIKEAQLQLEKNVEELKRSNLYLGEFAHAASHDLKEPIRKIHTFASRLQNTLEDRLDEKEADIFKRMQSATQRMTLLVDDLLTYSQISAIPFQMESVNLAEKVQVVLSDLELQIEEKKAVISIENLPTVQGYKRQLQQLFQNLIGNALKYSKKDVTPEILIRSEVVSGTDVKQNLPTIQRDSIYHLITVEDNGIGFDQQYAERIFSMFQRLHGKSEYEGTGIGLSIVRKVVDNHGGHIWAESKPGEGSTFKVLLPVR